MLTEPAFSHSTAWPPFGFDSLPPEPEDPRPTIARGALLIEPSQLAAVWRAGSAILDRPADEPLQAARPVTPSPRQAWKAAILVSCLLHAAAALAFLTGAVDRVEIAGADEAGAMLLGNAPDDQSAAGDGMEATNVTLITMLDPKPVATVRAELVEGTDTVRPVEESAVEETAQPQPAEAALDKVVEAVESSPQPSTNEIVESVTEVAPTSPDPTPEVLTAQTVEPAPWVIPKHIESLKESTSSVSAAPVQAEQADPTVAEVVPSAERETTEIENPPVPQPKPVEEIKPVEPAQSKKPIEENPVRKKSAKKAETKKAAKDSPTRKADKADKTMRKAGSGGSNKADSRRGVADGLADGRKELSGKGGVASAAGNAAASNYPGKVAAKLRRAVRSVARTGRARASNDVLVSFTVNAGGGLAGVRIARSSGSQELDQAALAVVRRAAPFPPIPTETGRRNWAFTLPLGMR